MNSVPIMIVAVPSSFCASCLRVMLSRLMAGANTLSRTPEISTHSGCSEFTSNTSATGASKHRDQRASAERLAEKDRERKREGSE